MRLSLFSSKRTFQESLCFSGFTFLSESLPGFGCWLPSLGRFVFRKAQTRSMNNFLMTVNLRIWRISLVLTSVCCYLL